MNIEKFFILQAQYIHKFQVEDDHKDIHKMTSKDLKRESSIIRQTTIMLNKAKTNKTIVNDNQ